MALAMATRARRSLRLLRGAGRGVLVGIALAIGAASPAAAEVTSASHTAAGASPATAAMTQPQLSTTAADIERAARLIRNAAAGRRMILLGELHGTREVPQLAAALIDAYSRDEPVLLAVELKREGHAAIHGYLDSDGSSAARDILRRQPFLEAPDGRDDRRRNESVLDLFEHLRQLRHRGRDVAVLPFDSDISGRGSERRDAEMAARLRVAYGALPGGRLLVVAGNVHAMLQRPDAPIAKQMQTPMGQRLADLHPFSPRIGARSGQSWACTMTCGPAPAIGGGTSGPSEGAFARSYDYEVVLPSHSLAQAILPQSRLTPWRPARGRGGRIAIR